MQKSDRKPVVNELEFDGRKIRLSFYDGNDVTEFKPYTQSYAMAFTEEGKIVIGRYPAHGKWLLPGGTIEEGEHPDNAMIRELDEELSLEVIKYKLLGAQLVEYLDHGTPSNYQLRYAALVRLKELTVDPDKNVLWDRKSVTPEEFINYVPWGSIGEHLRDKGHEQYLKWKNEKM